MAIETKMIIIMIVEFLFFASIPTLLFIIAMYCRKILKQLEK